MINDNKRPLYEKGLQPEDWYHKIKNWCSLLSLLLGFFFVNTCSCQSFEKYTKEHTFLRKRSICAAVLKTNAIDK